LYSALAAALGSSVSGEQEVQQFSFILISPLVVSVVLLPFVLGNPNSTAAVVLSLLPPFTPIIMYMRICSQTPPLWQIALSIALLAGSVWAMVWLEARDAAGDDPVAKVQLRGAMAGFTAQEAEIWQPGAGILI
jgi:ABC-2 type transport system permease protein